MLVGVSTVKLQSVASQEGPAAPESASVPQTSRPLVSVSRLQSVKAEKVCEPVVVAAPPMKRSPALRPEPLGLVVPMTRELEVVAAPVTLKVPCKVEEALVVSMAKILLPEPSCTSRAVVEEIFIRRPPPALKPAKKTSVELCSSMRLEFWPDLSLTTRVGPIRLASALSESCWTSKAGTVDEGLMTVVVARVAPLARKGVPVETVK